MTQTLAHPDIATEIASRAHVHNHDDAHATQPEHFSAYLRTIILIGVIVPFAAFLVGIFVLWGWGIGWIDVALFVGMYIVANLSICLGYHRLFTHRAFETVRPIKYALAIGGSMSAQGALFNWVATHRRHHQHSDHEDDPHSPHLHGEGFWGMIRGYWHAHVGWVFDHDFAIGRYVGDLQKDAGLRFINATFGWWVGLGLIIPAVIGGLVTQSWMGALLGFFWGGLVRICFGHHVTWSINSVCHIWGSQPFRSDDHSRNNALFGVLAFGEGWHNNHHAFPTSARHGLRWWQLDLSYVVIRTLEVMRLAWKVRRPAPEALEAKLKQESRAQTFEPVEQVNMN